MMKYILLTFSWLFGVLFTFVGLAFMTESPILGLPLVMISSLLLPPVRKLVYSKTNIQLSLKQRGLSITALLFVFMILSVKLAAQSPLKEGGGDSTYIDKTIKSVSVQDCVNKVHDITWYEKGRLSGTRKDNFTLVHYINNNGTLHSFRCVGDSGKVQLYAKGAQMWLDMGQ